MALNKAALKSGIQSLCGKANTAEEFATGLSNLIDAYVKTGTVTVATGILVSTAGTAAAQTGATTSIGTGTIA